MIKSIMKTKLWMVSFCFVFEEISSSISLLLFMLLAHRGKYLNSRAQMFYKIGVLKNFAVFTWLLRPVHYTFLKFFLMIDNWYFRVIFYFCKISPRNRKNFATDWLRILVKRWFFCYLIISLSQRIVSSSNCKEKLLTNLILVSHFSKYN